MFKIFLFITSQIVASIAIANPVDVFVMAGQSNMLGLKGDASYYPEDSASIDQKIPFFLEHKKTNSEFGSWGTMSPQPGIFKAGYFGPEVTFARCLSTNGYKPFIFKYAVESTSLASRWKRPGQDGLYDKMTESLDHAMTMLVDSGYTPKIRGLVWIQGESDARRVEHSNTYRERLLEMIGDFRKNVAKDLNTSIVLGVDEQHPDVQNNPTVIASQQSIASEEVNVTFSSMIGLPKADKTHLLPIGLESHGNRLCQDFLALQKCRASDGKNGKCVANESPTTGGFAKAFTNKKQITSKSSQPDKNADENVNEIDDQNNMAGRVIRNVGDTNIPTDGVNRKSTTIFKTEAIDYKSNESQRTQSIKDRVYQKSPVVNNSARKSEGFSNIIKDFKERQYDESMYQAPKDENGRIKMTREEYEVVKQARRLKNSAK